MMWKIKYIQETYLEGIKRIVAIQQKSLKLNAVLNVFRTAMNLIFPLITFPYTSRVLLPEGSGKINFATSIVSYFSLIAALGINAYGIREGAKVRDNKQKLSQLTKELFTISMVSTVVAYSLFFVAIFFVPKFSEYRVLLCISSASILLGTLSIEWLYSATEDYVFITIRSFVFQIISIILLFIFVKTKEDYLICAGINVFSSAGSSVTNFIHRRKIVNLKTGIKTNLKQHLKPIFILFAMSVTTSIYTLLDTSMLGFISGDFEVGIYHAATKINKLVLSLVVSIGTVLLPRLSYFSGNNNQKDFEKLIYKAFGIVLLLGCPCTIGLCLLCKPVVLLLSGESYVQAIPVMRIMNPIIIIISLSNVIGIQMFMPLKKEKWTLYSVIAGAVTNFTLNLLLIPKLASTGAAIATLVAETIVTATQFIMAKNMINLSKILRMFIIYIGNSLVMGIAVFLVIMFTQNVYIQLLIGFTVGVLVYIGILFVEKNEFINSFILSIRNKGRK